MLRTLQLAVYRAAKRSGHFAEVASGSWRRNRLVVPCNHGIALDENTGGIPPLHDI